MKRLIIMAALTVAAFGFNEANAQKVIKDAAGVVYIDVQDMPAGAFSTSSLNVIQTVNHAGNSVFKKLQIAKADLSPNVNWATACGISTSFNTTVAAGQQQGTVNTGCKAYSAEGNAGKWRTPTQKELYLIWIMKDALVQAGASALADTYYWTSSEDNADYSWYVKISTGTADCNIYKTSATITTRCVREVTN